MTCPAIFDIFARKLSDLSCSHEKERSKRFFFVNSVNVYYAEVKVSQKMEESMAIFGVSVKRRLGVGVGTGPGPGPGSIF